MDDRKSLIQRIKTQNGILKKQNRIIDAMAETIIEDTSKLDTFWCNGCQKISECPYQDVKQCVREYFEKEVSK